MVALFIAALISLSKTTSAAAVPLGLLPVTQAMGVVLEKCRPHYETTNPNQIYESALNRLHVNPQSFGQWHSIFKRKLDDLRKAHGDLETLDAGTKSDAKLTASWNAMRTALEKPFRTEIKELDILCDNFSANARTWTNPTPR